MKCPERLVKETFREGLSVINSIYSINRAILCTRIDVINHSSIEVINGLNGLFNIYHNAKSIECEDDTDTRYEVLMAVSIKTVFFFFGI
jgi:hypothetical protein